MNQYITNESVSHEGIGSLFQYVLDAYLVAYVGRRQFAYTPISNFEHSFHDKKINSDWAHQLNIYITQFLLPQPSVISEISEPVTILKRSKKFLDEIIIKQPDVFQHLQENFHNQSINLYFEENVINIATHIRVFSSTDSDLNPIRQYYSKGNFVDQYYYSCLKNLISVIHNKRINIHIYSQSTTFDHYDDLTSDMVSITIHQGDDLISDINHMIKSDIFVSASSSLSAIVNYYRKGLTISKKGFWHSLLNVIYQDIDGSFTSEQESKILNSIK
jgi:hypothetical protein